MNEIALFIRSLPGTIHAGATTLLPYGVLALVVALLVKSAQVGWLAILEGNNLGYFGFAPIALAVLLIAGELVNDRDD